MADNKRIGGIHYDMMRGCYDPNSILYKSYGAKGVKVCDEWQDREIFRAWCKDNGFKYGMQVRRRDTSKDFCPENCYITEPLNRAKHGYSEKVKKSRIETQRLRSELGIKSAHESEVYGSYMSMISRCCCKADTNYKYYGGRGITVCDEWRGKRGAYNFIRWAKDNNWQPGLTIDRIDVNGNYTPENCRWITQAQQTRNRRNVKLYDYHGKMLCLSEIAREENISIYSLYYRMREKGMSLFDAVAEIKNLSGCKII